MLLGLAHSLGKQMAGTANAKPKHLMPVRESQRTADLRSALYNLPHCVVYSQSGQSGPSTLAMASDLVDSVYYCQLPAPIRMTSLGTMAGK